MWYWWVSGIICFIMSAGCIISTIIDFSKGKTGPLDPKPEDFWGAAVFHGVTALLALWLLGKTLI